MTSIKQQKINYKLNEKDRFDFIFCAVSLKAQPNWSDKRIAALKYLLTGRTQFSFGPDWPMGYSDFGLFSEPFYTISRLGRFKQCLLLEKFAGFSALDRAKTISKKNWRDKPEMWHAQTTAQALAQGPM